MCVRSIVQVRRCKKHLLHIGERRVARRRRGQSLLLLRVLCLDHYLFLERCGRVEREAGARAAHRTLQKRLMLLLLRLLVVRVLWHADAVRAAARRRVARTRVRGRERRGAQVVRVRRLRRRAGHCACRCRSSDRRRRALADGDVRRHHRTRVARRVRASDRRAFGAAAAALRRAGLALHITVIVQWNANLIFLSVLRRIRGLCCENTIHSILVSYRIVSYRVVRCGTANCGPSKLERRHKWPDRENRFVRIRTERLE